MDYALLAHTDLKISRIGLGTMTFGEQNSAAEAFDQLDYAVSQGVNFIDTAELYAIPPKKETYGATEEILGQWLTRFGRREELVLATKVAGPGPDWIPHIREGRTRFNAQHLQAALEGSLQRLNTDYIDLYQLHWPERSTNYFGKLGYAYQPDPSDLTAFDETLAVLDRLMQAGKVRAIGLSNETPWGIMRYLAASDALGLPRVASVQNPYNLLNRTYEIGCAEISHRETLGLLAYSPLGFGVLSGKYRGGAMPKGARLQLWPHYARYSSAQAVAAVEAYAQVAERFALELPVMALAFVNSRPFVSANIIGATTLAQLTQNLASIHVQLEPECLAAIEAVHQQFPNPAP